MNGIDISRHNGIISWDTIAEFGNVDFAIIRAGYGKSISQKDPQFERNYAGAKAQGIPVGTYWYSYAITPAEAEAEARTFLQAITGKQFEFPVYFDIEEKSALNTGKKNVSAMVKAFCGVMEKAGYWCGVYASRSHVQTYFDDEVKNRYSLWLAEWGAKLNYTGGEVGMWQNSKKGKVSGISTNVDTDICYIDYPTAIKEAGKNGFQKPTEATSTPIEPPVKDAVQITVNINGKSYSGVLTAVD